ncbi:MAG TPA: 2-amino-4-hydroxy-6-hydroxymethyldihydropteridine diphosphokinase [Flavobacteriaceae bacterium]|nr:2-amino-4-hydroxy-6-hydroxymethyldihydropteridine diphosphokinase [Flavobacteriaceae bacterium]
MALGSNQGEKLQWLQKAVDRIFEKIGKVTAISSVYKTPALGFEGDDFLNACVEVKTWYSAEKTLGKLLEIETSLGRVRDKNGYQNRNIDLDLIFFGNECLNSKKLVVPHPKMAERKFVLEPLAEISAEVVHPLKNKSVSELLEQTSDVSEVEKIPERLKMPQLDFSNYHYISIEGNIGAGKTSFAHMIAEDLPAGKAGFNAKLLLEGFKNNPFLPKFYEEPKRYAFPLEMSFLADRYQQLSDEIGQYNLFLDFVVADYEVSKSLIFAEITLQEEEFSLYKKLFALMHKNLTKPDLYIYLYQNTDRLLENIKTRGRDYEQNIQADYLEKINRGYLNFIKNHPEMNIKIIDVSELDFVNRREDYLKVLREI